MDSSKPRAQSITLVLEARRPPALLAMSMPNKASSSSAASSEGFSFKFFFDLGRNAVLNSLNSRRNSQKNPQEFDVVMAPAKKKATRQHGPSEPPLTDQQVRAAAQMQELDNNLYGDEPGVSTGPPESTGGPGVSTGPSEAFKLQFGDNDAQCLSELLCQMEESITEVHGFDYELKDRRRAMIMTLPTSEGWLVMTCLLQAGKRYASLKEFHTAVEIMVKKRWLCLQAENVTYMSSGGPGPFQGPHNIYIYIYTYIYNSCGFFVFFVL